MLFVQSNPYLFLLPEFCSLGIVQRNRPREIIAISDNYLAGAI